MNLHQSNDRASGRELHALRCGCTSSRRSRCRSNASAGATRFGLVGAALIVLGFATIATIGLRIARDLGKESFGGLLVAGYTMLLLAQSVVHMTGTMNLLPMTGITLPLVSAGMSSLVVAWAMVGAIVGLSTGEEASSRRFVIRQDLAGKKG